MAGQSTVLSVGGSVTVPSSGQWTAAGIQQVQSLLNANNVVTVLYGTGGVPPAPSVPAGDFGTYVLEVPNGTAVGSLAIPDNYGAVILGQGSSGSISGGTANTTVLSAASLMSYSGNAGEVVQTATLPGATATIVDNAVGAVFDLGGGAYSVTAGGNQQNIQIDPSAKVALVASGSGDTIQLGDSSIASGPSTVTGTNLRINGIDASVTVNSFNNIISDRGGSATIAGITGSSTIFAGNNDVYYGAGATTEFIALGGAQTVFGGTGNDTVFNGGSNVVYNEGANSASTGNNIVVNESGNMTVNGAAGGAGAVFGGVAGSSTTLILGNSKDVFVGGTGGSDSIYGGNVSPTVFGGSNESLKIVGSQSSFIITGGSNSTYDASATSGTDHFFSTSTLGNTTLIASSGGIDTFQLSSVAGGTQHVIDIQNWHTGSALFLNGYSAGDVQTMDTAISGGSSHFTLSDGTTVQFTGNQPTHANGSSIF